MAHGNDATKAERLAEFLRRLKAAPSTSSFDEAYKQLCEILNGVEDEMTTIPFDPANWRNDGRMYPPQLDNLRPLPGRVDVGRFRSKGHQTLIGENGAIEIRAIAGKVLLSKPGSDGQTIGEIGCGQMNQLERLRNDLIERFPDLPTDIDAPACDKGSWFLDIQRPGEALPVVVEWRSDRGFGVSSLDRNDFGTGPDEIYPTLKATLDRLIGLILSGGTTAPTSAGKLANLRQTAAMTHVERPERLRVGQARTTRLKRRHSLRVGTLFRLVEAIGGPVYAEKLKDAGIATTGALLKEAATPAGRKKIENQTGIGYKLILRWANHVDVYRIKGVQKQYADLLGASGVNSILKLAQSDPTHLLSKMVATNEKRTLVRKLPTEKQVADWIAQAKKLPRVITD